MSSAVCEEFAITSLVDNFPCRPINLASSYTCSDYLPSGSIGFSDDIDNPFILGVYLPNSKCARNIRDITLITGSPNVFYVPFQSYLVFSVLVEGVFERGIQSGQAELLSWCNSHRIQT